MLGPDGTNFSHRLSCRNCGGCVANAHPGIGKVDVCGGVLDFGGSMFDFDFHTNYSSSVLRIKDGKPKFADFPKDLDGTGILVDE